MHPPVHSEPRAGVIVVQKNDVRRENLLKELAAKYNHRMSWLGTEGYPLSFKTPKDPDM
jgi:hypothetical protein